MREIKFRGYSIVELASESQWINNGHGVAEIEYADGAVDVCLLTPYGNYEVAEDSVGEYTGLKDKNGKEIYEGDIVKFEPHDNTYDYLDYKDKLYSIEYINASYGLINIETGELDAYLGDCAKNTIEVVGNTYENPKLLK